jgi:phosphoglycolate phosphatase
VNQNQSPSPAFRAVLWDLDGTIMDSQEGILATMRHTLSVMGCAIPHDDDLFGWIGPSFPTSLRRWTSLDDAGVAEASQVYGHYYAAKGAALASPFPGVVELIHSLHSSGVPLGLATSKPRTSALQMVESIGLLELFSARGCASDDETRGTKWEVMSDAMAELADLSILPNQMLMVGDRIHDFEAARQLGVPSVAVGWGYGKDLEWSHADYQVSEPDNLRELLEATLAPTFSLTHQ